VNWVRYSGMTDKRGDRRGRVCAHTAAFCLVALLAACGGGSDPEPTPTVTVAPTATETPAPSGPATLDPVVWTESVTPGSNEPGQPVDQFTTEASTIYAVVRATNLPAGAGVSATWTYNDTSLDAAAQSVTVTDGLSEGYIEFHLTRSADVPWPDGRYAIEITLDGETEQRSDVQIVNE
jgi:hypothetical protein